MDRKELPIFAASEIAVQPKEEQSRLLAMPKDERREVLRHLREEKAKKTEQQQWSRAVPSGYRFFGWPTALIQVHTTQHLAGRGAPCMQSNCIVHVTSTCGRVRDRFTGRVEDSAVHELALNPDAFTGGTDGEILSTLAHEMAHVLAAGVRNTTPAGLP